MYVLKQKCKKPMFFFFSCVQLCYGNSNRFQNRRNQQNDTFKHKISMMCEMLKYKCKQNE